MRIPIKTNDDARVLITTVKDGRADDAWTAQHDNCTRTNQTECPECATNMADTSPCLQIQHVMSRGGSDYLLTAQVCINDIQTLVNALRTHNPKGKEEWLSEWIAYIPEDSAFATTCLWCGSRIGSEPFYALAGDISRLHADCVPPLLDGMQDAYDELAENHADIALPHSL